VKIPAPDVSSLATAKEKAVTAMSGINAAMKPPQPVKIPPPDTSGLTTAKEKAVNDMSGIKAAMKPPQPVKIPEPDMSKVVAAKEKAVTAMSGIVSAMQAAAGPARAAGAAVGQGLAAGLQSEDAAVAAAAQHLAAEAANAMRNALQTHSPSKVTEVIGADAALGVAAGLKKKTSAVKSAATQLSQATISSLQTGLLGGQSAVDAVMTALGKGPRPQDITTIQSTVSKLESELQTALGKKVVTKSEDSALTKFLEKDSSKLQRLASKRAVLMAEITNAQQIATQVISGESIMTAQQAEQAGPIQPIAPSDLITGMQQQAGNAQAFAGTVAKLKKEGLNASTLNQIIQAGPEQGLATAQGIDTGGKGAIAQLNTLQQQINQSAASIGDTGGPAMYQAGVDAGSGVAKGLKSQLASVESEMGKIGKQMVSAVTAAVGGNSKAAMKDAGAGLGLGFAQGIASETSAAAAAAAKLAKAAEDAAKNTLKSHSPSIVFRDLGYTVPQGIALGFDDGQSLVAAAASRLASAAAGAYTSHPAAAALGAGGGAVSHNYNTTVNVQGSVIAERNLNDAVQQAVLVHGSNNWQMGQRYPGRAA
jgi:hypothetical protein